MKKSLVFVLIACLLFVSGFVFADDSEEEVFVYTPSVASPHVYLEGVRDELRKGGIIGCAITEAEAIKNALKEAKKKEGCTGKAIYENIHRATNKADSVYCVLITVLSCKKVKTSEEKILYFDDGYKILGEWFTCDEKGLPLLAGSFKCMKMCFSGQYTALKEDFKNYVEPKSEFKMLKSVDYEGIKCGLFIKGITEPKPKKKK